MPTTYVVTCVPAVPKETSLLAIQEATSSAKSMSHVPGQVWRTPRPVMVAPTSSCVLGLRKSLPSSAVPMPTVVQAAVAVQKAGFTPRMLGVQLGLALSPRPSEKSTMKSALQPLQGPLLPFAIATPGMAPAPNHHGFSCPPMYQAVLNIISAIGLAVLVYARPLTAPSFWFSGRPWPWQLCGSIFCTTVPPSALFCATTASRRTESSGPFTRRL